MGKGFKPSEEIIIAKKTPVEIFALLSSFCLHAFFSAQVLLNIIPALSFTLHSVPRTTAQSLPASVLTCPPVGRPAGPPPSA